jgi:hypothetical protein
MNVRASLSPRCVEWNRESEYHQDNGDKKSCGSRRYISRCPYRRSRDQRHREKQH